MRSRIFVILSLILMLTCGVFAFEVQDSEDVSRQYFSLSNDDVTIVNNVNSTNISVEYIVSGNNISKLYNMTKCSTSFCLDLSLSDLIVSEGGSVAGLNEFNITVAGVMKTVYLDIERPNFNYINYVINPQASLIEFSFDYSDNSEKVSKVELVERYGDTQLPVADLTNKYFYNYSVEESGNYIFTFKIYDVAGNYRTTDKIISVGDIFVPKISNLFVILKDNDYSLSFNLTDYNLSSYKIIQGDLFLTELISGKNYIKTINIPFESGEIIFEVTDDSFNSANKSLSLNSPISNKYVEKYSNSKTFNFESSADNCYLTKIGGENHNDEVFSKSSNDFSKALSISSVQEYLLEFYCEEDNFREYFTRAFYYDINDPSLPEIEVSANDEGGVDIGWSKSEDSESSVEYKLYRGGKVIYEGSKLSYEDIEAVWPNTYDYYLEAYDKAQNTVKTETFEVSPKKVKVTFESTLKDSQEIDNERFGFTITTDKGNDINIKVKKGGDIVEDKSFTNITSSRIDFNFVIKEGANTIEIDIVDEFGNKFSDSFFVNYQVPVLIEDIPKDVIEVTPVVEEVESDINESIVVLTSAEETFNWMWFIIILVLLGVFIWYFVFNEDKLRYKNSYHPSKKKSKKNSMPLFNLKGSKDSALEKDFNRIKKERIARQLEREREVQRLKQEESRQSNRLELEQKKMDDLAGRREVFIPFTQRQESKIRTEKLREEPTYDEDLDSTKSKVIAPVEKKKFFAKRKKEEIRNDPFSQYLQRVQNAPSWSSTRDYVHQEPKPEPKPDEISPEEYEQSLTSKKSMEDEKKELIESKDKRLFSIFRRSKPAKLETIEDKPIEDISQKEVAKDLAKDDEKPKQEVREKVNLDDYLNKRIKNKRRNLFFAERSVDSDLRDREN